MVDDILLPRDPLRPSHRRPEATIDSGQPNERQAASATRETAAIAETAVTTTATETLPHIHMTAGH